MVEMFEDGSICSGDCRHSEAAGEPKRAGRDRVRPFRALPSAGSYWPTGAPRCQRYGPTGTGQPSESHRSSAIRSVMAPPGLAYAW